MNLELCAKGISCGDEDVSDRQMSRAAERQPQLTLQAAARCSSWELSRTDCEEEISPLQWARWLPDGSGIVSVFENGNIHFSASPQIASCQEEQKYRDLSCDYFEKDAVNILDPWLSLKSGDNVFDIAFPQTFSWETPRSCCCAIAARDHPIHVRSAEDGTLVASFMPLDKGEELIQAQCLAYSGDSRLFAGGRSRIFLFNLERPGRPVDERTLGCRRSKGETIQKGIISAIDVPRKGISTVDTSLVACGTYSGSVCMHDMRSKRIHLRARDSEMHSGALTQLTFAEGSLLLSGHRQDCHIRCWDVRNLNVPLFRFSRQNLLSNTLLFDVRGRSLATGTQSGEVLFYDLVSGGLKSRLLARTAENGWAAQVDKFEAQPLLKELYSPEDAAPIVAAGIHPISPLLLSAHAHRCFQQTFKDETSTPNENADTRRTGVLEYSTGDLLESSGRLTSVCHSGFSWTVAVWRSDAELFQTYSREAS